MGDSDGEGLFQHLTIDLTIAPTILSELGSFWGELFDELFGELFGEVSGEVSGEVFRGYLTIQNARLQRLSGCFGEVLGISTIIRATCKSSPWRH